MSIPRTLFIFTETSTHAGTGSGLGAVDLPIQREKTTGYPIIQGSGIKGALRSQYKGTDNDKKVVFGPDDQPDYGGAVSIGDARILAFPVRSLKGVCAWVTCYDVLMRFFRDYQMPRVLPDLPAWRPQITSDTTEAYVSSEAVVIEQEVIVDGQHFVNRQVVLEEFMYTAIDRLIVTNENGEVTEEFSAQAWNWADWLARNALPDTPAYRSYYENAFRERFIILPDEDFRDFTLYATQIETRVRLDRKTKTAVDGALFTQEALPADTLLYVPVTAHKPRMPDNRYQNTSFTKDSSDQAVLNWLVDAKNCPERIQIGADETIGYGRVALRWGDTNSNQEETVNDGTEPALK